MKILNLKKYYFYILTFLSCLSLLHCESISTLDTSNTQCHSNEAKILVGDGFFQICCGCTQPNEISGTFFYHNHFPTFTCHLSNRQTTVFFIFSGTQLPHLIQSTGSENFGALPWVDLKQTTDLLRVHGVTFPQKSATYDFIDLPMHMTGQIFIP